MGTGNGESPESFTGTGGTRLPVDRAALDELCRRHGIRRLALFGSFLNGTAGPDSDVDLLVEFDPERTPGMLALATIEDELAVLFGGRRIDLRTPQELSRNFRDAIVREAAVQYAR